MFFFDPQNMFFLIGFVQPGWTIGSTRQEITPFLKPCIFLSGLLLEMKSFNHEKEFE